MTGLRSGSGLRVPRTTTAVTAALGFHASYLLVRSRLRALTASAVDEAALGLGRDVGTDGGDGTEPADSGHTDPEQSP